MCLGCLEAAGNHSQGEVQSASMRELDVVIARVPTVLRPQIQEAASPLNSCLGGFCKERAGCMLEKKALL